MLSPGNLSWVLCIARVFKRVEGRGHWTAITTKEGQEKGTTVRNSGGFFCAEAHRRTGLKPAHILRVLRGERKSTGGHQWKYV